MLCVLRPSVDMKTRVLADGTRGWWWSRPHHIIYENWPLFYSWSSAWCVPGASLAVASRPASERLRSRELGQAHFTDSSGSERVTISNRNKATTFRFQLRCTFASWALGVCCFPRPALMYSTDGITFYVRPKSGIMDLYIGYRLPVRAPRFPPTLQLGGKRRMGPQLQPLVSLMDERLLEGAVSHSPVYTVHCIHTVCNKYPENNLPPPTSSPSLFYLHV